MTNHIHASATPHKSRTRITTVKDRDDWIELLLQVKACELSGAAKLVGIAIALHVDEAGRCARSREAIADFCGMDARSVRRMIRKLEELGWLRVDRTTGFYANSFSLRTPDEPTATRSDAAPMAEGRCDAVTQ